MMVRSCPETTDRAFLAYEIWINLHEHACQDVLQ
jgi:hypothetical protein